MMRAMSAPLTNIQVSEPILAAMRHTNAFFATEVVQNGNAAAMDQVYTANARILPPGAPMIEGREQIKAFWTQAIAAMGIKAVKLSTIAAEAAGDGVVEIGAAELTVGDGSGVAVKYVVHWKQEDGTWKWNVDIWNT
jgi:ketosteroid isomerase-like protein